MIRTALTVMILGLIAGTAPVGAQDAAPPSELPLLVSADWLIDHRADPDLVVLHVARDRADYDEGHIPGARFVHFEDIVENRDGLVNVLPPVDELRAVFEAAGVSDDSRVVLYGDMNGLAATRAFFTLDVLGHPGVAILDGGLAAYRESAQSVSRHGPEVTAGTFSPRLDDSVPAEASWIAAHLAREDLVIVDARPRAQFSGEEPGADIERPGHIPGAVSLFWEESLQKDGTFLPRDELKKRWSEAGVTHEKQLVTYCRTGVQASHAYFTARYLGLAPMIYDPSFIHWSNMTEYPVATD